MSKIKLDLSQFQHIRSNAKTTTLRHKGGHELTISHGSLSPEGRAQLEQLSKSAPEPQKMAEGGSPDQTFAYDHGLPCLNPSCKSNGKPHPNCRCYQRMAKGGMAENVHYCAYGMPHDKSCEYYAEGGDTSAPPKMPSQSQAEAAQKGLNKPASEQISEGVDRLANPSTWWAEGGKAQENPKLEESTKIPPENKLDYKQLKREYIDKNQTKFIKGGSRKMYADPEPGQPVAQDDSAPVEYGNVDSPVNPHGGPSGGSALWTALEAVGHHIMSGGMVGKRSRERAEQQHAKDPMAYGQSIDPYTTPESATPEPVSTNQDRPDNSTSPSPVPGVTPEQNQIDQNQNAEMPGGMSQGTTTPPEAAAPPPAANNPSAGSPTTQHPALASPQQYQQAVHDNVMDEARAWSQDLSEGHIRPETYQELFASKDTLGKIGTIFGLLLGGIGSGLTHQPNVMMDMMNKEIDRDFEAQKASSSNRQNYLKLAQQHELNEASIRATQAGAQLTSAQTKQVLQDANIKAKMFMQRSAVAEIAQKVDAMPEGPAKQQAINAIGMMASKLDLANSDIASQFAANKSMMRFMGQGYGGPGGEASFQQGVQALTAGGQGELAKDMQSHHFPGISQRTSIPIESKDRDTSVAYQNVNDLFNRSLQFAQQSTPKNPSELIKYKAAGQALHGKLIAAIKQAQQDGVYKPAEAHFILSQIGDSPASVFAAWNSVPKIKEYQLNAQNEYNNLLGKYGVNPQAIQGQVQPPGPQIQMGPKTKRPMYQDAQGQWRYKSQ